MSRNTVLLLVLQFAGYVAPLLVVPYLARTLGVESFGVVAFGLATVQYLTAVASYGYGFTAPQALAQAATQKHRDTIASTALAGQTVLVLLCLVLTVTALFASDAEHRWVVAAYLPALAAITYQPLWYFQGIERMGWVTGYNLLTKFSYVALIYLTVRTSADLFWVPASYVISAAVGMVAAWIALRRVGFRLVRIARSEVVASLRSGWPVFLSRAAVTTYTIGATVILGLLTTKVEVAHFALAQQIYTAAQLVPTALVLALFPVAARTRDLRLVVKCAGLALAYGVVASITVSLFATETLTVIGGPAFAGAELPLQLMMAVLAVTAVSVVLGYPLGAAVNDLTMANRTTYLGAAVMAVTVGALVALDLVSAVSMAAAVLGVESTVLIARVLWLRWLTVGRAGHARRIA